MDRGFGSAHQEPRHLCLMPLEQGFVNLDTQTRSLGNRHVAIDDGHGVLEKPVADAVGLELAAHHVRQTEHRVLRGRIDAHARKGDAQAVLRPGVENVSGRAALLEARDEDRAAVPDAQVTREPAMTSCTIFWATALKGASG